jgi:hypothetical protein
MSPFSRLFARRTRRLHEDPIQSHSKSRNLAYIVGALVLDSGTDGHGLRANGHIVCANTMNMNVGRGFACFLRELLGKVVSPIVDVFWWTCRPVRASLHTPKSLSCHCALPDRILSSLCMSALTRPPSLFSFTLDRTVRRVLLRIRSVANNSARVRRQRTGSRR